MPAKTLQSQISKGGETQIYPLSSTEHCGRGLFFIMSKRFQCHLKTVRHKKYTWINIVSESENIWQGIPNSRQCTFMIISNKRCTWSNKKLWYFTKSRHFYGRAVGGKSVSAAARHAGKRGQVLNLGRQMAGRRDLAGSGPRGGAFFWTELGLLRLNFRLLTVAWKQTVFFRMMGVKKRKTQQKIKRQRCYRSYNLGDILPSDQMKMTLVCDKIQLLGRYLGEKC